jgi:hypothetical protein
MISEQNQSSEQRVREILVAVKPLAAEFYRLTGKPLGVTGYGYVGFVVSEVIYS